MLCPPYYTSPYYIYAMPHHEPHHHTVSLEGHLLHPSLITHPIGFPPCILPILIFPLVPPFLLFLFLLHLILLLSLPPLFAFVVV